MSFLNPRQNFPDIRVLDDSVTFIPIQLNHLRSCGVVGAPRRSRTVPIEQFDASLETVRTVPSAASYETEDKGVAKGSSHVLIFLGPDIDHESI